MLRQKTNRIKALVRDTGCEKDLRSLVSAVDECCETRDTGLQNFLECHHPRPERCKFVLPFGYGFFCKCPLSLYIRRELRK